MRIIKKVELNATMEVKCRGCGSELEVSGADLTYVFDERENATMYWYECPVCDDRNWLYKISDTMHRAATR